MLCSRISLRMFARKRNTTITTTNAFELLRLWLSLIKFTCGLFTLKIHQRGMEGEYFRLLKIVDCEWEVDESSHFLIQSLIVSNKCHRKISLKQFPSRRKRRSHIKSYLDEHREPPYCADVLCEHLNYSYHTKRLKDWASCCLEWQICWCFHVFLCVTLPPCFDIADVGAHTPTQLLFHLQDSMQPPETSVDNEIFAKTIKAILVLLPSHANLHRTIIQWKIKYLSCASRTRAIGFRLRYP